MESFGIREAERLMRRLDVGVLAFFVRWLEMVESKARRVWVVQANAEAPPVLLGQ